MKLGFNYKIKKDIHKNIHIIHDHKHSKAFTKDIFKHKQKNLTISELKKRLEWPKNIERLINYKD